MKKIQSSFGLVTMASPERQKALTAKASKPKSHEESNKLVSEICKYIRGCGGMASQIDVKGTYREKQGIFTESRTVKGFSDIQAVCKGIAFYIEVKVKNDVQSEAQRIFEESIKKAGGVYLIARTFEGFKYEFEKHLKMKLVLSDNNGKTT